MDARQAEQGRRKWGGKGLKNGKEKCGWMNEQSRVLSAPLAAAVATPPETLPCSATWRMQRRGQGRGGRGCRGRPPGRPAPACAQRPSGMAPAAARRPGARDSAYSEAPGRHVSRAASLQSPRPRAPVSARRSLHLLPLAAPQPVRNDAVRAHPLPARLAPAPGGRRGGGLSRRGGGERGEGRTRRPEARPAGACEAAAASHCTGGRAGRRRRRGGCWTRRGSLRPARPPSRLASGGRSSRAFYPADIQAPDSGVSAPALSLTPEPRLCKLPGLSVCPKEKQTVTDALRARASFQPGLSGFFPSQTLCIPRLSDVPQGACFLPTSCFLPSPSSLPWPGSPHTQQGNCHPRKVFAKDACPCPSFLCPAYHKITIYSEKGEKKKKSLMVPAPRKPLSAIISCPRSSLDSSIKKSCMKFPKYSINNPLQ